MMRTADSALLCLIPSKYQRILPRNWNTNSFNFERSAWAALLHTLKYVFASNSRIRVLFEYYSSTTWTKATGLPLSVQTLNNCDAHSKLLECCEPRVLMNTTDFSEVPASWNWSNSSFTRCLCPATNVYIHWKELVVNIEYESHLKFP